MTRLGGELDQSETPVRKNPFRWQCYHRKSWRTLSRRWLGGEDGSRRDLWEYGTVAFWKV